MYWEFAWVWSLPLVMLTIVVHVVGLGFITLTCMGILGRSDSHGRFIVRYCIILGAIAFFATAFHAFEAGVWALAYVRLGALPDGREAILYSLNAITSYGHADVFLDPRWSLMGSLEALNGIMLFGLTTAFLFAVIQTAWRR